MIEKHFSKQAKNGADGDVPHAEDLVLVRVITTTDELVRDEIIRSTNRQTKVTDASLRATDDLQRHIETYFKTESTLRYDRRKSYYRNLKEPAANIVSISFLTQAMLAIWRSEPATARARPSEVLKKDDLYTRVFDPRIELPVYLWAAQTQKAVNDYLRKTGATAEEQSNLPFHVSSVLIAQAIGNRERLPAKLKKLVGRRFSDTDFGTALKPVKAAFSAFAKKHDLTMDRVAKNPDFVDYLFARGFKNGSRKNN